MDIGEILSAIGTVGFPIVACGALFWMINKTMRELTSAVNNNTQAINIMTERMNTPHDEGRN